MSDVPVPPRSRPRALAVAAVSVLLIALAGCPPAESPGPSAVGAEEGQEQRPDEGSGASVELATGEDPTADWSDAELHVRLPVIETQHRADRIVALAAMPEGVLVVTHARVRGNSRIDTWLITEDGVQEAVDTLTLTVPDEAVPRFVAVPGLGALIIKPTDNVAEDEIAFNLVAWSVDAAGEISDEQRVLRVPEGLALRESWDATRLGDEAVICARAAGADVPPPRTPDVACGTVGLDAAWRLPLARMPLGEMPAHSVHLGRGGDRVVLFTFLESEPGRGRVYGSLLEGGAQLAVLGPVELTGEDYVFTGAPEFRRAPMGVANSQGAAYALPRIGSHLARGGTIAADGSSDAPRLQLTELGTYVEHPILIESAIGASLVYESAGQNGERGAVLFGDGTEAPQYLEVVTPLGASDEAAASARFGAADNGFTTLVYEEPSEELPRVVILPEAAWGDADYVVRDQAGP